MSAIHFDAAELSSILTALNGALVNNDYLNDVAETLAAVSVANTEAFNAHYGESYKAVTAGEILAAVRPAADFGQACATAYMLESNCEGLLTDEVSAKLGLLVLGRLLQKSIDRLGEARESIAYLQGQLAEARKPAPKRARA